MTTSFIAEVVVIHPDLPLAPTLQEGPNIAVQVQAHAQTYPESPVIFYTATDSDFQEFESSLTTDHTVEEWHRTMEFEDCHIYRIRHTTRTDFMTPKLANLGIHTLSIQGTEQGWKLKLQTPDKESLGAFWEHCRDEEIQFTLEKLYSTGAQISAASGASLEAELTDRQREVARTVTQMGYYDQDGATAKEVAAELDISPSTLSTHLRRIMAKVFEFMFEEEPPDDPSLRK